MKICNNTPNAMGYTISTPGSVDCGTVATHQTADLPGWNNKTNVKVSIAALPPASAGTPFSVTIPSSGTGMAVTIGMFQE